MPGAEGGGGGGKGGSAAASPTGQAVQVLLGPLKEMLEGIQLQHEVMREMVSERVCGRRKRKHGR